jgi:hypothetical protein
VLLVSEQQRFLLRELQALLVEEGLTDIDDVVVVAARRAYPEYLAHSAYICQAGRSFRPGITHLGFYTNAAIQTQIPYIERREDGVLFSLGEAARRLQSDDPSDHRVAHLINQALSAGTRDDGQAHQVFLLSAADDEGDTVLLEAPIVNTTKAASGGAFAWTLSQRYTNLARLQDPTVSKTGDL